MDQDKKQFLKRVKPLLEQEFGTSSEENGVVRVIARDLGFFAGNAIIEVKWVSYRQGAADPHPVLQFNCTLAKDIEDKEIPTMKEGLWELNKITLFGHYGFFKPLRQIYHCYRIPVNLSEPDAMLAEITYILGQLKKQLNTFLDYVLMLAEGSETISLGEYIIGTNADQIIDEALSEMNTLFPNDRDQAQ